MTAPPGYDGQPVVLVHVFAREGSDMAYCRAVPYAPADNVDRSIVRVACPVCERATPSHPVPKCTGCGTAIGWTRAINGKTRCEPCERAAVANGSRESGQ